ncbi:hypothetical protein ACF1GW_38960 [Streptomyces achromogenes]|uniref:hypothetical protein n=1 Tax=Streptomyces achromogenes TaxID=67255 RepID=UPI0036FBED25
MRTRTTRPAAAILLFAALTACSSGSNTGNKEPSKSTAAASAGSTPKAEPSVDCSDKSLDQATWVKNCGDGASTGGDGTAGTQTLAWGQPAKTVGSQSPVDGPGGGDLEVTPTTVVYAKAAMGNTAANGMYAIITVKDRATGSTAATETARLDGGWQWVAPDGQALDEGENDASSITPHGFVGGGMVQAGTWHWRTIAFDLTPAQAKGGTIAYTDGAGTAFRWRVPATDQGPEVAAVKKGMEGNY